MSTNNTSRLKAFFTRRNAWLVALFAIELVFLLGRFAGDFGAGKAVSIGPDLLIPYAEECTNDSRGVRVEDFTGVFATTRWIDIEPGSYQVVVTYRTNGGDGAVNFVRDIMPTARYDPATLPAARTRTVFSLWMPTHQESAQLQFTANGGVMYVTDVQLIPTHSWAYVRFLSLAVFLLLANWLLLLLTHRVPFPIRSVKARYSLLAIAGIVALACLPLGFNYLMYGHDLSIHLARIEGLKSGLLSGQLPVRMDPGIINDKGYPFSLMYADLLLYPAAFLRILGFSLQTVYQLYVAAITLATALVTRHCLRKMVDSELVALLGAALYTLSFYRLSNVYVRAAVGEYSAMLFLPLVVYGLWRIYIQPEGKNNAHCWVPLAIGFTGLLQTHLLTTEMAGIFTLLFCLLRFKKTFRRPVLPALCKAAGVSVLWNLWFLVPLAQYMVTGACTIGGKYDASALHDSAAFLGQIFLMFGGTGTSQSLASGIMDEMPLSVGTALAFGAALFILCLMDPALRGSDRRNTRTGSFTLGFGALAVFMASDLFPWYELYLSQNPLSGILGKLQFAWRFLGPATVLLVVCTCAGLAILHRAKPALFRGAAAALLALTILPAGFLTYSVCKYSVVVDYQSLAAVDTLSSQVGGGEYLPPSISENPDPNAAWTDLAPSYSDGLTVDSYQKDGLRVDLTLTNTTDTALAARLPLFYYPGYRATAQDGARLTIVEDMGNLMVMIPAGYTGAVSVRFAGFWFWRAADLISLAAVLFSLFKAWQPRRRRRALARK